MPTCAQKISNKKPLVSKRANVRDGTRRSVNVRSRSVKGEWVEKVYDYVTACSSLKGIISDMRVKEDFESRQHKAVTFVVQRGKGRQEWNEEKKPRALPGYRGRLPRRSTEDKGREEGEESEQWQEKNEKIEEGIGSSQRMAFGRQNPRQR